MKPVVSYPPYFPQFPGNDYSEAIARTPWGHASSGICLLDF